MDSQSHGSHDALRGVSWMLGAVLSFALMAVAVRELLRHMGVLEILALRTLVTLLLIGGLAVRSGIAPLRTRRFPAHAARAVLHLGGQWCWMYAIGVLALATVFAIEFTMPVWVAILAALFLGERLNQGRMVQLVPASPASSSSCGRVSARSIRARSSCWWARCSTRAA
jgi:drug/metabolite transporter (DMT)-like permease